MKDGLRMGTSRTGGVVKFMSSRERLTTESLRLVTDNFLVPQLNCEMNDYLTFATEFRRRYCSPQSHGICPEALRFSTQ